MASQQIRAALPGGIPLVGIHSGESIRVAIARSDGGAAVPLSVGKEQLGQLGKGTAAQSPIPGVPDGAHGSLLLFADPQVPAALTRNLLEALDARYPNATKCGVVVAPGKAQAAAAAPELDWEPAKDSGRQLRTRDRSDGHGWIRGDPTVDSTDDGAVVAMVSAEFTRRPFGVKRYCPCLDGKGAMIRQVGQQILEMQEKGRYKGDAMGQCADKGVKLGMVVRSINGEDMRSRPFEDVMDLLGDQGIADPDAKSAATWGEGGKLARQPLPEAPLPVSVEFAAVRGGAGSGAAHMSLDGEAKMDVVLGLALQGAASSSLDLVGCQPLGPALDVAKAGANTDGGFSVDVVVVNGKAMPAAMALKGYAKAAGLSTMQGVCVGMRRPQVADGAPAAAQWSVYPMAGVTPQGGLVLRSDRIGET
ncbi:unnamed protein product [Prorocentrum cordatum]|uniref:Phosphoglycerate kinase n=1 Tax=Prorocentrum cordatum TaxID=2364126 RepID=A0ABN9U4D1_9DINO|nr:unnamed protein product [Polarella glacialis]